MDRLDVNARNAIGTKQLSADKLSCNESSHHDSYDETFISQAPLIIVKKVNMNIRAIKSWK